MKADNFVVRCATSYFLNFIKLLNTKLFFFLICANKFRTIMDE